MLTAAQRDRARRSLESRMTETVTAGRFTDTTDPATGDPVRTATTVRYTGKAQVAYPSIVVSDTNGAGQIFAAQSVIVKLPVSTSVLFEGDEVEVTASESDGSLIGRRFRVSGNPQAGQVTAHRYPVEELS